MFSTVFSTANYFVGQLQNMTWIWAKGTSYWQTALSTARTEEGREVKADRHLFSERGILMVMEYWGVSHNNCWLSWVYSDLSISVKNYSHDIWCSLRSINKRYTLHTTHYILCNTQYTFYTANYTLLPIYKTQCTLHTTHCTLNTVQYTVGCDTLALWWSRPADLFWLRETNGCTIRYLPGIYPLSMKKKKKHFLHK